LIDLVIHLVVSVFFISDFEAIFIALTCQIVMELLHSTRSSHGSGGYLFWEPIVVYIESKWGTLLALHCRYHLPLTWL
jgi:hypothetical protein